MAQLHIRREAYFQPFRLLAEGFPAGFGDPPVYMDFQILYGHRRYLEFGLQCAAALYRY
ncbi:MAG TPA: hypothetical protein VN300_10155 [Desulfobacterales bacterium]|nr:hypothetical protein [Desulfobacterales bacterium]